MKHLIYRTLAISALLFTPFALTGCASGHTAGQPLILDASSANIFYVELQEKDRRNLAAKISQKMNELGYSSTTGQAANRPSDVNYLVKYIDHWAWDMRMYLADLRIEVRDVATGAIVAYGQSVQNSLKAMGWSHDKVIDLAVAEMLITPESEPEPEP